MTRERVDALEEDKRRLLVAVELLQVKVDQLGPENAGLKEALGNAEANNGIATVLIAIGGFAVSFATFTGRIAPALANTAAGCLMAGILMMLWQSARRWRRP